MKKSSLKALLLFFLLVCVVAELIPSPAFAVDRQYTERIYSGNVGAINGTVNGVYIDENVNYGDTITIVQGESGDYYKTADGTQIAITADEEYFVKGLKESGKEKFSTGYDVKRDQDYVVAYGIKGQRVQYTVQYLLWGSNTKLASDAHFYAEIGDSPVTSYIYIDGYVNYRRSTKVLTDKPEENILFVYYTKPGTPTTTTTTVVEGGGGGGAAVAGGAAANANPNNPANNPNQNPNTPQGTNNTAPAPAPTQQYAEYEDILDLDVPLAAPNIPGVGTVSIPNAPQVIEPNQNGRVPNWMLIAGLVLLVGLISVLYWYLLFYRKKKKYACINDDYEILGFDNDDGF
jgi:hypothetical protein